MDSAAQVHTCTRDSFFVIPSPATRFFVIPSPYSFFHSFIVRRGIIASEVVFPRPGARLGKNDTDFEKNESRRIVVIIVYDPDANYAFR